MGNKGEKWDKREKKKDFDKMEIMGKKCEKEKREGRGKFLVAGTCSCTVVYSPCTVPVVVVLCTVPVVVGDLEGGVPVG